MIFRRSRKLARSRDRCHLLSFLPTSRAGRAFDGRARGHLREEAMLVKCAVEHLLQKRGKKLVKFTVDNICYKNVVNSWYIVQLNIYYTKRESISS